MDFTQGTALAPYTSWQIGGPADWLCFPQTEDEIVEALRFAEARKIPWTVLGGGSNVLISDAGVEGLVIGLRKFSGLKIAQRDGRVVLDGLAGTGKNELLKTFLKFKLAPAGFLAGLPGDIGGGVVMNAGIAESLQPREFQEIVDWVEVLRLENSQPVRYRWNNNELHWRYRHSSGWQPGIITRVGISWTDSEEPDILQKVRDLNRVRLMKQPLDLPSCGSVFVNPPGHKAAQLIDGCGLKGFTSGRAQVSPKHANFIVNLGGATARDVKNVIEHVRTTVHKQTGVSLTTEVVAIGRP